MDQSNLNTGSQFSQPIRQIISLLIVVGLSGLGVVIAAPSVWPVFASNIYLNGAILFVFAIGVSRGHPYSFAMVQISMV